MTKLTSEKPCVWSKPVIEAKTWESAVRKETAGSIIDLWLWEISDTGKIIGGQEFLRALTQMSPVGRMNPDERRKYFEEIAENKWLKWEDAKEYVELSLLSFEQELTKEQYRMINIYRVMMDYGFNKEDTTEHVDIEAIPEDKRTPEQQKKYLEICSIMEWIDMADDYCLDHP